MNDAASLSEELRTAWLHAADAGAIDDMRALLSAHPALLNCSDRFQQNLKASTALHLCAWRNHAHAAEFLLQSGADVEARDEAGMTPLQIDILRVCMEKMRPIPLLRARCIDVGSPVALAKYRRQLVRDRSGYDQIDTSTLETLLKYKADVNSYTEVGEMALLLALEDGLIKHVKLLLAHGADAYFKDKHGRTTLDIAAEHGYGDLVELLLKSFPGLIDLAGERALFAAIHHDSEPVLQLLFDAVMQRAQGDPLAQERLGGRMFHTAIQYDARESTKALLARGVPVDFENDNGETALHVACKSYDNESLLQLLLSFHADANRCSPLSGMSPFHMAVHHHCTQTIEILASHGGDINIFDHNGQTPLVFAAVRKEGNELMDSLINNGAHFLFRNAEGRDKVAPILASWILNLLPERIPALVDELLVAGCVEQERIRWVVASLVWSRHTEDALLFLCLALFTASLRARQKAHALVSAWLEENNASRVTQKLLHDALLRRESMRR